jgi:hypothetical protein
MVPIKRYIRLLAVIAVFIMILSCLRNPSTGNDFLIKVDSFNIPATISSGTPFDIEFFGTIGFDQCTKFKTFNQIYKNSNITIELWGTYDNNEGACVPDLIYMNGQKLNLTIPLPGEYTIKIIEPNDYILIKQIIVK